MTPNQTPEIKLSERILINNVKVVEKFLREIEMPHYAYTIRQALCEINPDWEEVSI